MLLYIYHRQLNGRGSIG